MIHTLKPPHGVRLNTSHPMANGLAGCWLMNEGSGLYTYDLSGNGNHGTLLNSSWSANGIAFPAVNARIGLVYPIIFTGNMSIVCKYKTISDQYYGGLIGDATAKDFIIFNNHSEIRIVDNGSHSDFDGWSWNFNQWYSLVISRAGAVWRGWRDAVEDSDLDSPITAGDLTFSAFGIGNTGHSFVGELEYAYIYNKILSVSEVASFHLNPYAMFEPEPIYLFGSAGGGGGSALTKSLSDTVSLSDSIIKKPGINKSDSISMSDTFINSFGLNKSDTISMSDVIIKNSGLAKSDVLNMADEALKSSGINKSDTINLSDSILKTPGLNKSDSVNLTDEIIKTSEINKADTINLTDSFSKVASFLRSFSDTINLSDTILKNIGLSLSDTINLSDNFNAIITLILSLNDTVSMSDSISKEVDLSKEDAINLTDEIIKSFGLNESDTVNLSDIISKSIEINKSDTVNLSDNFSSLLALILAINDIINMSDAISKEIDLSKSDTINLTDDLSKLFGLTESDIINLADNFSTSSDIIYALLNFVAKNKSFNFNAKNKSFNFNAKIRGI